MSKFDAYDDDEFEEFLREKKDKKNISQRRKNVRREKYFIPENEENDD